MKRPDEWVDSNSADRVEALSARQSGLPGTVMHFDGVIVFHAEYGHCSVAGPRQIKELASAVSPAGVSMSKLTKRTCGFYELLLV